jgi:large subunit ribosomal protein L29
MNMNELRKKDSAGLSDELHALLRQQFNLRMQRGMGEAGKPHLFKQIRRDIARIKTLLNEQEK